MTVAARFVSWVLAGLMIGAILRAAQWHDPALLPWVAGFMLASLAVNLRGVAE